MPQPAEVDRLARQLVALYQQAQADIEGQLARLSVEPRFDRRRARLRELSSTVSRELAELRRSTRSWLEGSFADIYALGAADGAATIGDAFAWTQTHREAVVALAGDIYDDVLQATGFVDAQTKAWVRQVSREQATLSLLEGRTAEQAAREFRRRAAGEVAEQLGGPVGMVRYADGSLRRLDDYADMLLRTKTAQAYNAGALNVFNEAGVTWVEVFDGADCGWTSHDDGDRANGSVRRLRDAYAHPLSHPRCRRSFGGRPDIIDRSDAARARPTTTAAQRADQAEAERQRARQVERRRQRRNARQGRPPRKPRQARARQQAPEPQQPQVREWVEQPNIAAVERALADMLPNPTNAPLTAGGRRVINMKGLDPRVANSIGRAFSQMAQQHPETATRIGVVGSSTGVTKPINEALAAARTRLANIGRAYADAADFPAGSIRFNATKGSKRNYDELLARLKHEESVKWNPVGGDDVEYVVRHEFGHHLDYLARRNGGAEYAKERAAIWQRHVDEARAAGEGPGDIVSRYALTNAKELMAEAIAEATNPARPPRAAARELYELVLKYTERFTA